jgi:hypothetical protein
MILTPHEIGAALGAINALTVECEVGDGSDLGLVVDLLARIGRVRPDTGVDAPVLVAEALELLEQVGVALEDGGGFYRRRMVRAVVELGLDALRTERARRV